MLLLQGVCGHGGLAGAGRRPPGGLICRITVLALSRVTQVLVLRYRVCVDMASLLAPGEGLLVGSFARALFLVHSECAESAYINSRPFRVNAGPVRSCTASGKTLQCIPASPQPWASICRGLDRLLQSSEGGSSSAHTVQQRTRCFARHMQSQCAPSGCTQS